MVVVDGKGVIAMVNGEIERLFGYARDELLGRPIENLLPEYLRSEHVAQRDRFATKPSPRFLDSAREFNGRRKDGSEFPIEIGLNPIRVGDEIMVISTIVDLSERKRIDQTQDEFVATVSHELRTPLTSIAASLGLLRVGAGDNLPEPARNLLQIAETNCQRLVRMVNDILDLKKLEAGQMKFHFERCAARTLIEKAIEANQGVAANCNVALRLDANGGHAMLYVDPDRFMQLLTNLIGNALKFSPAGAEIVVAFAKRGDDVRITVRDRGPGIPEDFKPRIFEAFAQADGSAKKGGTGLGLSIARRIVGGMRGRIGFEDAEGGGTVFYVDLPNADHLMRWQTGSAAG
jgi:PAS domain S-box-containing protein